MEDLLGTAWKVWLLGGGFVGLIGWIFKVKWDANQIEKELQAHQDSCNLRYAEISKNFERVYDKIDDTKSGIARCNEQLADLNGYLRARDAQ